MARSVDASSHMVIDAIDTVLANGCASGRGGGGSRLRLWARGQHTPRGGRTADEQRRRRPVRYVALARGPLDAYSTVVSHRLRKHACDVGDGRHGRNGSLIIGVDSC